jgi:hypothetical protein
MEVMKNHGDFSDRLGRLGVLHFADNESRKAFAGSPNTISSTRHTVKHLQQKDGIFLDGDKN